jgi:hypothetical protein
MEKSPKKQIPDHPMSHLLLHDEKLVQPNKSSIHPDHPPIPKDFPDEACVCVRRE